MDSLLPDVPVPWRRFSVLVTVPRESPDGPLVPHALPGTEGVIAVWAAERVLVGVTVDAADEAGAVAAGRAVAARLLGSAAGMTAEVRPA
jgi:hypothetical protein